MDNQSGNKSESTKYVGIVWGYGSFQINGTPNIDQTARILILGPRKGTHDFFEAPELGHNVGLKGFQTPKHCICCKYQL